jgi:HlyD family secretion protein
MIIRGLVAIIGLSAIVAGLAAANLNHGSSRIDLDWRLIREPAREVFAERPGRGPIVQTITAPGKIESVEEAEIASQVIGRVVEVNVKEGDHVKKGDVLVQLDQTEPRARLDSTLARIARLEAAIAQSESDLEKANRDVRQFSHLAGKGFSTPTELADARTALAKAQAALQMSRNDLSESVAMKRTSEEELQRTTIRAPIDGVVSNLNVDVGEIVIAGTTNLPGSVLLKVSDPLRMRVRAEVDETDVLLVRRGQPSHVFLQADPLRPILASVDRVAPQGKTTDEVVSFETLIQLDDPPPSDARETDSLGDRPALRPEMTATVEIEVRRATDALSVPAQAVVHRRRKDLPDTPAVRAWADRNARTPGEKAREAELRYIKIVFVLEGDVARARPVETGLSDERRVEILAGLEPEEQLIVGPFRVLDELKDGDRVILTDAAAEAELDP